MNDVLGDNIFWSELKGSTVLVTGVKGLIGSALVRVLQAANKRYGLNINTIAHTRDFLVESKRLKEHCQE